MGAEAMTLPRFTRIRLRWWLLAALLVALAFVLAQFVPAPSGPRVKKLIVTLPPIAQLSAGDIREAALPALRGGLLEVNLHAVRKRVESLAWVKRAAVRRVWPHALAIDVTAEHPLARWGANALVDASGQVFTPTSVSGFAALPVLRGPDMSGDPAALFKDFRHAHRVLSAGGYRLTAFIQNARGEVTVKVAAEPRSELGSAPDSELEIELGNENPRAMLARFITVAAPALGTALARAATVDMRYPNGFAVGWKRDAEHG